VVILTYTPLRAPPEQPISGFARTYIDWGYRTHPYFLFPLGLIRVTGGEHIFAPAIPRTSAIDGPVGTSAGAAVVRCWFRRPLR
jgi:hypothetical protein